MKRLIINADDFGYSYIFNKTILNLLEQGKIMSTSVMVNWITGKQSEQVSKLIKLFNMGTISVGLHIEITRKDTERDIEEQIEKFISIFNLKPSHLDIHKPTRTKEECSALQTICNKYSMPSRNLDNCVGKITTTKTVINGTDINMVNIEELLSSFTDGESYEILVHPGTYDTDCKSSLNKERELDIEKIYKINNLLSKYNIKLISFNSLNS